MQHNRAGRKLGRTTAHRRSLFRNQLSSLFTHERIQTTLPKAKDLRPLAEKMITLGKREGPQGQRPEGRNPGRHAAQSRRGIRTEKEHLLRKGRGAADALYYLLRKLRGARRRASFFSIRFPKQLRSL